MLDTLVTYALVAVAAGFVVWRVLLPSRARNALRGADANCASAQDCGGGCGGCPSAKKPAR